MKCYAAEWPAPPTVHAWVCSREQGGSRAPFAHGNLGVHVGDDPAAVARNRADLLEALPGAEAIQWLDQVHGTCTVSAARPVQEPPPRADAIMTRERGLACAVLTADCLPVCFCDNTGTQVAVAHAGWRGLAAGILEQTVSMFESDPGQLMAWLGPAIGPCHFEVGGEVRDAFLQAVTVDMRPACAAAFSPSRGSSGKWQADLYQLARVRLYAAGVQQVSGGGLCTYCDADRWYSYRREQETGRFATLIYLS